MLQSKETYYKMETGFILNGDKNCGIYYIIL